MGAHDLTEYHLWNYRDDLQTLEELRAYAQDNAGLHVTRPEREYVQLPGYSDNTHWATVKQERTQDAIHLLEGWTQAIDAVRHDQGHSSVGRLLEYRYMDKLPIDAVCERLKIKIDTFRKNRATLWRMIEEKIKTNQS